jgi:drug/metabolite transporter (DMT)-like permease
MTNVTSNKDYLSAVGLTLISSCLVGVLSIVGKYLIPYLSMPMLIFLRLVAPALVMWWMAYISQSEMAFAGSQKLLLQRSLMSMLAQACFFSYLYFSTAFNATLLLMTSPLYVPVIARLIDKTPIKPHHWASLILSFIGIALILKPDTGIFQWSAIFGIASGIFHAIAQWTYHRMSKQTKASTITMYMYTYGSLIALIPLAIFYSIQGIPDVHYTHADVFYIIVLVLLMAFAAINTQVLRGFAFKKVNKAHSLMPFVYVAVVFVGFYEALVFKVYPDIWSVTGAILVFFGLNILVAAKIFGSKTVKQ